MSRWPGADPEQHELALAGGGAAGRGRLVERAPQKGIDAFAHRPTAGVRAGSLCWGAGHPPNGLAADLRLEEGTGPVYESSPLAEPLDILGTPVAVLHVAASQPVAHLVVRLGSIAPDGSVEQVSEGVLNLTHRESHIEPAPLEPGRRYEVGVPLRAAGYRFPPGHRVYLSIASAHWPVIWPSPRGGELSILRGPETPSRLELPLAPTGRDVVPPPRFREDKPTLRKVGSEISEPTRWETVEDRLAGTVTIRTHEGSTTTLPDGRTTLYVGETLAMTASEREPGHGRFENTCKYRLDRDGHRVSIVADGTTIASDSALDMTVGIRVELAGKPFFGRTWREEISRDLL